MSELFLGDHVPADTARFARLVGPDPNPVLVEMHELAEQEGFPIVGPAVGGWLCQIARVTGARRVFEFGSGFGYSACWFARALPPAGEIVLTDADAQHLEQAQQFLERMDAECNVVVEVGDAVEIAGRYDGPFEVVLLDIEKYQYVDAFEAIRADVPVGGVIAADNTMTAGREESNDTVNFPVLLAALESGEFDAHAGTLPEQTRSHTRGIYDYLTHIRDTPGFESVQLPLGDGVTVTTRVQ